MRLITAQLNDSYYPVMDGVANVTRNYAYWLNRKLGPCYVMAPWFPDSNTADEDGTPVLRYLSMPLPNNHPYRVGLPRLDPFFVKRIASIPFELVHAQCPLMSGRLAYRIGKQRKIPVVVSFHTKYREDFRRVLASEQLVKKLVRIMVRFYDSVDAVWAPSSATVATLREYGYQGEVTVVQNGTDLTVPRDVRSYRDRANAELGIGESVFVFLFIGQHVWEKNHRFLLESLKLLKSAGKSYLMLFVGTGYAAEMMKENVATLDLDDMVRFLGPVADRERIKRYYARANLFLFPSLYDTSPLTLREAAAFRLPVVLIEGATAAEGIEDSMNGFLAPGTPEGYARKLRDLMDNPRLIEQAGEGARRTLYRTWERVADEVIERYGEIIEAHKLRGKPRR